MKKQRTLKLHGHPDVTTAAQCRISIFQPTRRPRFSTGLVETAFGKAEVSGRLGQPHRDFIECCRLPSVALAQGLDGAERYCCIIDPNKLRTAMSGTKRTSNDKPGRVSWQQLKDIAEDLRQCRVQNLKIFSRPNYGVVTAGILETVMYQGVGQVEGRAGQGNKVSERELWKIPFSEAWTALIGDDLPISYGGHLPQIVSLRHGISQALARFMLSHQHGATYGFNEAFGFVGATGRFRDRLDEIIKDAHELAGVGICIDFRLGQFVLAEVTASEREHIPGARDHIPGDRDHIPGERDHIPGAIGFIGI
jgi:hypothetical protein